MSELEGRISRSLQGKSLKQDSTHILWMLAFMNCLSIWCEMMFVEVMIAK